MNALQVAMLRARCAKYEPPRNPPQPERAASPVLEVRRQERPPRYIVVQRIVAKYYDVTRVDIIGPSREDKYMRARWVACYLVREERPEASFPLLGRWFARDHTTVMHSIRKIERLLDSNVKLRMEISELRQLIAQSLHLTPEPPSPI